MSLITLAPPNTGLIIRHPALCKTPGTTFTTPTTWLARCALALSCSVLRLANISFSIQRAAHLEKEGATGLEGTYDKESEGATPFLITNTRGLR